jgi:two-component system sensor histidine kinase/response regulator
MKEVLKTDSNQRFESPSHVDVFIQNYRAGVARPVVLLADGSRLGRETLAGGLRRCGFVVREIGSVSEVEEVASLVMPDVILLDLRFPDGDGANAVRELKESTTTARIPVIVLGSPALGRCREDCLAAGAAMVLKKPVCVDEVSNAVRSHLAKPSSKLAY